MSGRTEGVIPASGLQIRRSAARPARTQLPFGVRTNEPLGTRPVLGERPATEALAGIKSSMGEPTEEETARKTIPTNSTPKAPAVKNFAWLPVGVNYNKPARGSVSLI